MNTGQNIYDSKIIKERVLITVKTYPTLSKKYGETVCTAGIRNDGSWIRIYPVPFRRLNEKEQYSKFDWLECRLLRNKTDPRPETYRPIDFNDFHPIQHIDTSNNWNERRRLILKTAKVYTCLDDLINGAKANKISLAVFKPRKLIDFIWEEESRDWDIEKLREIRKYTSQLDMFEDNTWRQTFKVIPKLPYSFSYQFEDDAGKYSEMQILDWEIGALYWNCLNSCDGNEQQALFKIRQKYFDTFRLTDLHYFLGTTQRFHSIAPNPWVIIGVFPIPYEFQLSFSPFSV